MPIAWPASGLNISTRHITVNSVAVEISKIIPSGSPAASAAHDPGELLPCYFRLQDE
jgi:hypothetical protein